MLLSHADRTRFMAEDQRGWLFNAPGPVHGCALHDGFLVATWSIDRPDAKNEPVLVVRPAIRLPKRATERLEAEGRRMLRFLEPDADDFDVRFDPRG